MNVAILIGRLTKDPEIRYTGSGKAVTQFTLAVDDPFTKGDKKADFINIVTWNQTAEACNNYLKKGSSCAVEGRISTRTYDNNEGRKVYVTEVIAANVKFLDSKKDGNREQPNNSRGQDPFKDEGQPVDISDDELPF